MDNLYEKIISEKNIQEAYLDVVARFERDSKTSTYQGVDGQSLFDYDVIISELISEIKNDLVSKKQITPALEVHIPKRTKEGTRTIYLHTVHERIRAQAVYRIVEPYFDRYFSKYLFSYRKSHPHYRAIKSVVKRYHQKRENEYVLIGDISSYSDIINPEILKEKIRQLGFDDATNELLFLYVDMPFFRKGRYQTTEAGIITGLPVTVLFNNLYLDEFDKVFGEQSDLYRRVGDDFIAFGTRTELAALQSRMQDFLRGILIKDEFQKIEIVERTELFGFLGFEFFQGTISILPISVKKIQKKLRLLLRHRELLSEQEKLKRFSEILFNGPASVRFYFIELIRHYNHVNNHEQIAWLSRYFFVRVTIFFFGKYSYRNWRKTRFLIKGLPIPSLLRYYQVFQSGKLRGEKFNTII